MYNIKYYIKITINIKNMLPYQLIKINQERNLIKII